MIPDPHETLIVKRWETDTRYYLAHLHRDLFDTWVLTTAWGNKRTNLGSMISRPVPSYGAGLTELHKLSLLRAKHGYRLMVQDSRPAIINEDMSDG